MRWPSTRARVSLQAGGAADLLLCWACVRRPWQGLAHGVPSPGEIVYAGAPIFLGYKGPELIASVSLDARNPEKRLREST